MLVGRMYKHNNQIKPTAKVRVIAIERRTMAETALFALVYSIMAFILIVPVVGIVGCLMQVL